MKETAITLRHEWDMGHRLPLHDGKCRRLHGHRYVAEVDLTGILHEEGPATGMVMDFYVLKQILSKVIGHWDHRTMLWEGDSLYTATDPGVYGPYDGAGGDGEVGVFRVPFMPTAESICREIMRLVSKELEEQTAFCTRVKVWETPTGSAEVRA